MLTVKHPDGNIRTEVTVTVRGDEISLQKVSGDPFRPVKTYVKLDGYDKAVSERDVLKLIAGTSGTGAKLAQIWLDEVAKNEI